MSDEYTARLRNLRREAAKLNATLVRDLDPFRHETEKDLFRRLPDSASTPGDANVTTSCTSLMALCSNGKFDEFFDVQAKPAELDAERRKRVVDILGRIVAAPWKSSRPEEDNAFTTSLVLRTAGFFAQRYKPGEIRSIQKQWRGTPCKLDEIARKLSKAAPQEFEIQKSLRRNPALGYWRVDGANKLVADVLFQRTGIGRTAIWLTTNMNT